MTRQKRQLWWVALLLIILSGCAVNFVPQQDMTPYIPPIVEEDYPVAFEVTYPSPFSQRESIAAVEQKLLSAHSATSPYIIEIYFQSFLSREGLILRVWSAGEVIYQDEVTARRRGGSSGQPVAVAEARDTFHGLAAEHFAQRINDQIRVDYAAYAAVLSENQEAALRRYLSDNRESFFYHAALRDLGDMAPSGTPGKAWHIDNKARYPGYVVAQNEDLKLWLTGPQGYSFWELEAALRQGQAENELLTQVLEARAFDLPLVTHNERYGHFDFEDYMGSVTYHPAMDRNLWDENRDHNTNWRDYIHTNLSNQYRFRHYSTGIGIALTGQKLQILTQRGIPGHLITAANLNDERYGEPFTQWRHERIDPEQYVHRLRINDKSENYLSPYTEDDVVAEWVNRAIDARIGATLGSTAGSVAGAQLGRNLSVPGGQFIGGMIGSAAGQSAGRDAAIQTLGGWDFIRETSDYSFNNLRDMAEYLLYHFNDRDDFMDVINAASAIYPGLNREVSALAR